MQAWKEKALLTGEARSPSADVSSDGPLAVQSTGAHGQVTPTSGIWNEVVP